MKKIIPTAGAEILNFDVEIMLSIYPFDDMVAASEYKGYKFPDGELPPLKRGVVWSDQVTEDYNAFLETLEDLLIDYYNFEVYYSNISKDHSKYLGMVAKDNKNNIILTFNFNLRVSNHDAHRSRESQRQKKEMKQSLAKFTNGKRLRPIVKSVKVNREEFSSYDDAVEYIDNVIEDVYSRIHRDT